jgi:tRNA-splicing ligase RtcB
VIIPGSMGASSYVLAGEGNEAALESACHGAGRALTRGGAAHVDERVYARSMERLRVVTPIDPASPEVRTRRDILAKYHQRLKEEAPFAYKPITPVVQTVEEAGVARRVARLFPIVTVKG